VPRLCNHSISTTLMQSQRRWCYSTVTWRLDVSNFSGGLASIIRRAGGVTDGRHLQDCWLISAGNGALAPLPSRKADRLGVRAGSVPRGQLTTTDRRVSDLNLTSNFANCIGLSMEQDPSGSLPLRSSSIDLLTQLHPGRFQWSYITST